MGFSIFWIGLEIFSNLWFWMRKENKSNASLTAVVSRNLPVPFPDPPATVDPRREGGDVVVGHAEGVGDAHAALAVHLGAGVDQRGGGGIALYHSKGRK